jgi:maltoporin
MKGKLLLAALPLALACGSLAAQDVFELHGYMRAGAGRSSNGGEQATFFLSGLGDNPTDGPGFRLGNETDNYIELAMDVRAYDKGDESFKLHFRPAFREYYAQKDSDSDAGGAPNGIQTNGNNQQVWIREAWGEAAGMLGDSDALKGASIWAGRRFYMRQDANMRDLWYWNDSGDGAGIENINVGFAKFHYAYIQHDEQNLTTQWMEQLSNNPSVALVGPNAGKISGVYNNNGPTVWDVAGSPWAGAYGGAIVVGSHDFRLSDISLWKNSSFTVGFQYNEPHVSKNATALADQIKPSQFNNVGRQYSLLWTQSKILGGDNKVFVTHGDGSTFWNWYNPELTTKNNWSQVIDMLYIAPFKNFGMLLTAIDRIQAADHVQNAAADSKWTSIGIRPEYFFTKHLSVAAEIGQDRFKVDGDQETRVLTKKTLAFQISPQPNLWSRPVIRLFVTQAEWNKQANAWNLVGEGVFGNALYGTTAGVQVEAWW